MKDKLEEIFSLQKGLTEMMNLDRYPDDVEGRISALCTAMIHEAVELQHTTNWKWWKKPAEFNKLEAKEELIDIWHFLIQASLELELTPDDIEGRISALCTAMIHEAIELQRTTNWKWWKKPMEFNQAEAREELADIWHFLIQASLELGLTPDDILKEYQRKNEINRQRQKDGY